MLGCTMPCPAALLNAQTCACFGSLFFFFVAQTLNDGTVVYFYASADTVHTTFSDGVELFEFPNQQVRFCDITSGHARSTCCTHQRQCTLFNVPAGAHFVLRAPRLRSIGQNRRARRSPFVMAPSSSLMKMGTR